jgi:hypothetical protein
MGLWTNVLADDAPSLEEITTGLQTAEKLLFENASILIRYKRSGSKTINPPGPGSLVLAEWVLAMRDGKCRVDTTFKEDVVTPRYTIPAKTRVNLIRDKFNLEWSPADGSAVLSATEAGRNIYSFWYYTRNLSMNAPRYIARSIGAEGKLDEADPMLADEVGLPFLPDFLVANQSSYRVLPEPEVLLGQKCWRVEWPGVDSFLVDPARGYAIPHRAFAWSPGKPTRLEFTNSDYRMVKPGLWLPYFQVELRFYNPRTEDPKMAGKVKHRSEYELLEIAFDTVPDALFDVQLPVGTQVFDAPRNFAYAVDDESADPFSLPIAQGLKQLERPKVLWLWTNVCIVAGLCALLICRTLMRCRHARNPYSVDKECAK